MANLELSKDYVASLLKDNIQLSPNTDEKINYFRNAIKIEFANYRKTFNIEDKNIQPFADVILRRHNHKILHQSIEFQKTYFKNPEYINKLIKDFFKAEEAKRNPLHTFTRDQFIDPTIIEFENLIDRRYQNFTKTDKNKLSEQNKTLYDLTNRYFEELISGVILLEREYHNDAFILWRSLLETTTTLLILITNPKLIGKFMERQKIALMRSRVIEGSKQVQLDKIKESKAHLGKGGVPWYISERFGWAGDLIKNEDYNLKTLLEIVKLGELYPHYAFASLFVHEYLIKPQDLTLGIDFNKYLLTLYFIIYELLRVHISDLFTDDLNDAKKLEKGVRTEVKNFSARFKDFSLQIQYS